MAKSRESRGGDDVRRSCGARDGGMVGAWED